ncbi:extracellular solute-binding protein [Streptomyces sp. ODS28]|uniref:extracellular solute-binding protein n=1 Tax=Streptomyces sp. ODS28 TaxID=3136688 RepID=UPI0031EC62FB
MRRRRFLQGAAGAAGTAGAAAFGLGGCGAEAGDGEPLKVLAASYDKSVGASIVRQWKEFAARFEKKHPDIAVDLEFVSFSKIDKVLSQRVRDGRAPDIAQSNSFADYAEEHRLYSAPELFSIPAQADFIASFARAGEVSFTQYGIPCLASVPRLFYNRKLFAKAGIPGPPGSWKELASAARALKSSGVRIPYGLQLGPEAAEDEALAWMTAGEGGYVSSGGYDFRSPANVRTLEWLRDELVEPGLAGPDPAKLTRTQAYGGFLRGQVGMLLAHPVLLGTAHAAHVPYGHGPFPARRGGPAAPVGLNDWMMAFRSGGRRKDAGKFLTALYADMKSPMGYLGGQGTLPVRTSTLEKLRDDREQRELWKFIDDMGDAEFQPVSRSSWDTVKPAVRERIGKAVLPGGKPSSVLSGLQHTADKAEIAARR